MKDFIIGRKRRSREGYRLDSVPPQKIMEIEIIAEPSIPQKFLQQAFQTLRQTLGANSSEHVEIHHETHLLPLTAEAEINIEESVGYRQASASKDYCVIVVDMPLTLHGKLVTAKSIRRSNTLVVSYPALGIWKEEKRFSAVVTDFILGYQGDYAHPGRLRPSFPRRLHISARTVLGMVKANQPFHSLLALSGALAGALTAGVFGIFYSSIWEMAQSLSVIRLSLIAVTSISLMTTWLMISHKLWSHQNPKTPQWLVKLYNLSAISTLLIVIAASYIFLLLMVFLGALIIISPDFMEQTVQSYPGLSLYFRIAWLSASMGIIAGGIGSGFDSSIELKKMTQSGSYQQRICAEEE